MTWQSHLNGNPLPWLLEPADPGARYLTMRDLQGFPPDDPNLLAARDLAHTQGPITTILDKMHPDGYWSIPGPGYMPLMGRGNWRTSRWTTYPLTPAKRPSSC